MVDLKLLDEYYQEHCILLKDLSDKKTRVYDLRRKYEIFSQDKYKFSWVLNDLLCMYNSLSFYQTLEENSFNGYRSENQESIYSSTKETTVSNYFTGFRDFLTCLGEYIDATKKLYDFDVKMTNSEITDSFTNTVIIYEDKPKCIITDLANGETLDITEFSPEKKTFILKTLQDSKKFWGLIKKDEIPDVISFLESYHDDEKDYCFEQAELNKKLCKDTIYFSYK